MPSQHRRPTEAELSILRVLWANGPSTVRQVVERSESGTGYTTILKLLQIMTEKGLVTRDDSQQSHVFTPSQQEEKTQRQLGRPARSRLRRVRPEAGAAGPVRPQALP